MSTSSTKRLSTEEIEALLAKATPGETVIGEFSDGTDKAHWSVCEKHPARPIIERLRKALHADVEAQDGRLEHPHDRDIRRKATRDALAPVPAPEVVPAAKETMTPRMAALFARKDDEMARWHAPGCKHPRCDGCEHGSVPAAKESNP